MGSKKSYHQKNSKPAKKAKVKKTPAKKTPAKKRGRPKKEDK